MKTSQFLSTFRKGLWLATVITILSMWALQAYAQSSQSSKQDRNISIVRPASAQGAGKRVALVVGNGNYTALNTLGDNPRNDADDMARALEGFGFTVTRLKDSNRRDMNAALEAFGRDASGSEAALFYFAGHGMQIRGDNYLMPVNATAESEAAVKDEGVSLSRVLDELEGTAAVKIVLIDACRDNPITGKFRTASRGLAVPSSPPSGTVIAFAAEPGKTAANGNGRNGIFTAGLLKALQGKDLSLDSVLTVASEEVESQSNRKQTPYVNGPKTLQKNFHFRVTITPSSQMMDSEYWASVKDSKDVADFEAYLADYPQGQFRRLAANRVKAFRAVIAPLVAPAVPPATVSTSSAQMIDGYEILNDPLLGKGSLARDPKTGLVWQRCSVGQTWDSRTCTGTAKDFTFDDAQKLSGNGWRVPTIRELSSLIYCSSGKTKNRNGLKDGGALIANACDGDYVYPTIRTAAFPKTTDYLYWSSSPYAGNSAIAWTAVFSTGQINDDYRADSFNVRLVR